MTAENSSNSTIKAFAKKFITSARDKTLHESPQMAQDLECLIIQKNKEFDEAPKAWKALGNTELYSSQEFFDALKTAKSDKNCPSAEREVFLAVEKVLGESYKGEIVLDKRGMSNQQKRESKEKLLNRVNKFWMNYDCAISNDSSSDNSESDAESGVSDIDIEDCHTGKRKRKLEPSDLTGSKKVRDTPHDNLQIAISEFIVDNVECAIESGVQDHILQAVKSETISNIIEKEITKIMTSKSTENLILIASRKIITENVSGILNGGDTEQIIGAQLSSMVNEPDAPFRKSVETLVVNTIAKRFSS